MRFRSWAIALAGLWLWPSALPLHATSGPTLRSGSPWIIDVWESEDGLPRNSITAIRQTRDGYLWLGTLLGLVRFDGMRFTVFDESNTPGLNSPIMSLFEDSHSNLWVATERNGVALIEQGNLKLLGIGQGSRDTRVAAMCEDQAGAVWLYTVDGRLWRCQQGRTNFFRVDREGASQFRGLIAEDSGLIWIGSDTRLSAFRPGDVSTPELPLQHSLRCGKLDFLLAGRNGGYWRLADGRIQKCATNQVLTEWSPYPWPAASPGGNPVIVSAACEDAEGNLVVGTRGAGVYWFDAQGRATPLTTNEGLSYNFVFSLQVDREGSLWVGTDGGGLDRVKRRLFQVMEETRGLVMQSVCETDKEELWWGSNGGGIGFWVEGLLLRFSPSYVRALFVDRDQQVWAGTPGLGLYHYETEGGRFQRVMGPLPVLWGAMAIHQDREGRLWFGTENGLVLKDDAQGWKVFTTQDGLSANVVQAIADDPEGNLWVGTLGGGLNRFREEQFSVIAPKDGLPLKDISALRVDDQGVLWIGTTGSGLVRFHRGQWTRYTKREGLISNSVQYLLEDGEGWFWIGSNAGLMRVPRQALNDFAAGAISSVPCRAYGKADGLPTGECSGGSQPAACRTRQGKLWFPTIKGLVSVDPALLKPNPHPPPVMIESVLVEGRPENTNAFRIGWPAPVTIAAGKERLEIHYTSVNFAAPERARFRYRLEGHETDWTEAGNVRVARYTKLPPARYRFRVIAANEDGVWNEAGASLALIVLPPFWRTWWFLTAATLCLLGSIIGVVHYLSTQRLQRQLERLRQQETLQEERARIARDLHDQLGASLTQVALLGELAQSDKAFPDEVDQHARLISQTARDTTRVLDEIVWAVNPSNDTLDGLITYVCKYAQEFLAVAGLRYRVEIPPDLPETALPPDVRHNVFLASKEAVTNVVRHAKASEVRLRLRLEPARFTLEIQDNGRGFGALESNASRNGLRNMRQRMQDIGGDFFIGPVPDGGTVVRLTAPLGDGVGGGGAAA